MSETDTSDVTLNDLEDLALFSEGLVIVISAFLTGFFLLQKLRGKCANEVIYVSAVTTVVYSSRLLSGKSFTWVMLNNGDEVPLGRYFSWLLTCPVLLMQILANLHCVGAKISPDQKSLIIILDQCLIVLGSYAALTQGITKWIFFLIALTVGCCLFGTMLFISYENAHKFPKEARNVFYGWILLYVLSWGVNPFIWILGAPGLKIIDNNLDSLLTSFMDIFSKNLFGLMGWYLRWTYLCGERDAYGVLVTNHRTKLIKKISENLGAKDNMGISHEDFAHAKATPFCVLLIETNILIIKCLQLMTKNCEICLFIAPTVETAKAMMALQPVNKFDAVIVAPASYKKTSERKELREFSEYIVQAPYKIPLLGTYFDTAERNQEPGYYIHGIIPRPLDEECLQRSLLEWRLTVQMWRKVADSIEALDRPTTKSPFTKQGKETDDRRKSQAMVDRKQATMDRKTGSFFASQMIPNFIDSSKDVNEQEKTQNQSQAIEITSPRPQRRQVNFNEEQNVVISRRESRNRTNPASVVPEPINQAPPVQSQSTSQSSVTRDKPPTNPHFHFPA